MRPMAATVAGESRLVMHEIDLPAGWLFELESDDYLVFFRRVKVVVCVKVCSSSQQPPATNTGWTAFANVSAKA